MQSTDCKAFDRPDEEIGAVGVFLPFVNLKK